MSSAAENVTDPHVRCIRVLDETLPVYLRMAWRGDSENPALPRVLALAEQVWPDAGGVRTAGLAGRPVG